MDKSFLTFLIIGVAFLYIVTHFVQGIQDEDERFRNNAYSEEHKYDAYKGVDSVGRDVLNVLDADPATQIAAWNKGDLKKEYLDLFPDFALMKDFIKQRVHGEPLQGKLLKQVDDIETKYFSGQLSIEKAKNDLKSLR